MTDPRVCPAVAADVAECGRITATAYLADGYARPGEPYLAELADAGPRLRHAELLVAELDGVAAGTVTYCPYGSRFAELAGPGEADIRMLGVDPEFRRQGVGAALVRACVLRATQARCHALRLCSLERMRPAHRMYERAGFVRTPDRDFSPHPGLVLPSYALVLPRA